MLARGVRNVIYNYTDAQRKVRSATSNDAWGPSPALMHEIADLTDNVVAFSEIMPIVWKRLNDHGKNWRHVYKSLVLLDHLIKYGNERVVQQCKENIFAIQTLKDFQYVEDQKDQGYNIREKAKQLVALLKDDEHLRNERRKAQEGRRRYDSQAIGMDSNGSVTYGRTTRGSSMRRNSIEGSDSYGAAGYMSGQSASSYPTASRSTSYNDNLRGALKGDFAVPASQEEEQLQMQIAMAESQREAEDEERRRRNDDLKLRIALERSINESKADTIPSQTFDPSSTSGPLDSSLFESYPPTSNAYASNVTTNSAIPWAATDTRSSSQLGFVTPANDPWSLEPNNRTASASASGWQSSSTASANPWGGSSQAANNMDSGLSINLNDPWGLGASSTNRPTTTTSSPAPIPAPAPTVAATSNASKSLIDSELSEIFGNSATISTSNVYQQPAAPLSSNPWNIGSSAATNFQPSSVASGSISPPMSNMTAQGGILLYPTLASATTSSPTNASPLPSSLSASRKTPESFLGDKFSTLVNLDRLVPDPKTTTNPFGATTARTPNPFAAATKPPTLDQLTTSNTPTFGSGSTLPPPLIPSSLNGNTNTVPSFNNNNPFM